jgi:glyoxylase-like metal-dependent hydrolase (beta-lactamase superfamily II)
MFRSDGRGKTLRFAQGDKVDAYICRTCAVQYAPSAGPPERCIICEDERQYVNWAGQQWTTLAELKAQGYKTVLREHEPGLAGIGIEPFFGIGQRALLVQTPEGNVLWDCIGYIDDEVIAQVRSLGGIAAIAVSHPHFYGTMIEWARAFDAPVHIPEADAQWITRPDPLVCHFEGAVELVPGVTLIQTGGHFEGSAVVHWAAGAEGRGALLTGDSIQVVQDRRFVSFMWSYPNLVPLSASAVDCIREAIDPYQFDRIYGGWWHTTIESGARDAVERSAERYLKLIGG